MSLEISFGEKGRRTLFRFHPKMLASERMDMKKSFFIFITALLLFSCQNNGNHKKGFVIISPELAELFVLVDGPDRIIGVAQECDYPATLKTKSIVGNFGAISLEKIAELQPEYVLTSSLEQQALADDLKKLNIKVLSIYPKSIQEMIETVGQIGELTGKPERAKIVQDSLRKEWESLKNLNVTPKKIFVEIYYNPLMTADTTSFVGELIELAGGQNIFPKLIRDYCKINPEDVIQNNPELIVLTYPDMTAEQVKMRKGWNEISAVKNNRIFTVKDLNPDLILRAGPRCFEGVRKLRELIYE